MNSGDPAVLSRKVAVVMGVANPRSIGWAAVQALTQSHEVIVTYQNERVARALRDLTADNPRILGCFPCDVEQDDSIPRLFQEYIPEVLQSATPVCRHPQSLGDEEDYKIDAIVHSIAYANFEKTTLGNASWEAYQQAQHISAYSFLETARYALPLLPKRDPDIPASWSLSSSITALTYLGAVRAVPNYHIMGPVKASLEALVRGLAAEYGPTGVRVNAVSAGPLRTHAAKGIPGFTLMHQQAASQSPLQRAVTKEEVADTIAFLANKGTGITGQTIFVDGGFSSVVPLPAGHVT